MNKLEEQIKQWVISADKYHYLLESEEEYIVKEITKLVIEFAREGSYYTFDNTYEGYNGEYANDKNAKQKIFQDWLNEQR